MFPEFDFSTREGCGGSWLHEVGLGSWLVGDLGILLGVGVKVGGLQVLWQLLLLLLLRLVLLLNPFSEIK